VTYIITAEEICLLLYTVANNVTKDQSSYRWSSGNLRKSVTMSVNLFLLTEKQGIPERDEERAESREIRSVMGLEGRMREGEQE